MSAVATKRPITPRSQAASAASCRRAATRWCSIGAAATPSWPTRSRKRAGPCCSTTAPRPRAAGSCRPMPAARRSASSTRRRSKRLPDASIDLIVVNSVVQYLSASQFADALRLFHRLLKRDGTLLLGDIIAPDTPLVGHVTTFLRFAWRNGFFIAALVGLARNFVSPYRKLRRERRLCLLHANAVAGSARRKRFCRRAACIQYRGQSASLFLSCAQIECRGCILERRIRAMIRSAAPALNPRRNASTGLMRCAIR